ncbi:uncharacterized protein K441DRAFT_74321 [Cenococcum geophilum 1.58]|uniref:uncharacterized protein n=1 Tax=Cenococcum geophilum 1.58 TaxID=794803 RepID=UPI00358FE9EB|nr:hypothetical protein K441DRAFT_74321 [Cenococcum geophilum 1.58]
MSSFLRPWAFYFSQPRPLKDDPTGSPSHTDSDHNHYLSRADLYQGPIDVAPTDMPDLYDILLSDIDEKVLHNEISTALGSAYLSETPHLISPVATVDGIMFGIHDRVLFPLVVRFPRKSHSYVMHFLKNCYDALSPQSKRVISSPLSNKMLASISSMSLRQVSGSCIQLGDMLYIAFDIPNR